MTIPTTSWDETSPAGSTAVSAGDDRIREMKTQIREVINVDHDFPSSGQALDNGQHKQVTLQEQADLGTGEVGTTILGSQTVDGKGELCYVDEDDNTIQITTAGTINGAALKALSVATAAINDAAVTVGKLGDDAVETVKIKDLNVTTGKIAAAAVTAAKMTSTFGEYSDQGAGAGVTRSGTASADIIIFGSVTANLAGFTHIVICSIGGVPVQKILAVNASYNSFCFPVRKGDSWSVACTTNAVIDYIYLMPVGV